MSGNFSLAAIDGCDESGIKAWEDELKEDFRSYCATDKDYAQGCLDAFLDEKISFEIYDKIEKLDAKLVEPGADKKKIEEDIEECRSQLNRAKVIEAILIHIVASFKQVNVKDLLSLKGQTTFNNAGGLLGSIIDLLVLFIGVAAFVLLVVGGLRLILAAGNDNEIQTAKRMVTYAIMGLAVALMAYLIVVFVRGLLYR